MTMKKENHRFMTMSIDSEPDCPPPKLISLDSEPDCPPPKFISSWATFSTSLCSDSKLQNVNDNSAYLIDIIK